MKIGDRFTVEGYGVVVTGGASGLGPGFTEALAANGARVTRLDIDGQRIDVETERLRKAGYDVRGALVDVRDHATLDLAIDAAAYMAARAGAAHLMRNVALELAAYNITVNATAPASSLPRSAAGTPITPRRRKRYPGAYRCIASAGRTRPGLRCSSPPPPPATSPASRSSSTAAEASAKWTERRCSD